MKLLIYKDGNQTGPFEDQVILQMLKDKLISGNTLAWKEGSAEWLPLSTFIPCEQADSAPITKHNWLAKFSFYIGIFSVVGWILLFWFNSTIDHSGISNESIDSLIGLMAFCGILINIVAFIIGIIRLIKNKSDDKAIIGSCINGVVLLIIFVLFFTFFHLSSQS